MVSHTCIPLTTHLSILPSQPIQKQAICLQSPILLFTNPAFLSIHLLFRWSLKPDILDYLPSASTSPIPFLHSPSLVHQSSSLFSHISTNWSRRRALEIFLLCMSQPASTLHLPFHLVMPSLNTTTRWPQKPPSLFPPLFGGG